METLEYKVSKRMIETNNYVEKEMAENLGLFKLYSRITNEQYLELMDLIKPKTLPENEV